MVDLDDMFDRFRDARLTDEEFDAMCLLIRSDRESALRFTRRMKLHRAIYEYYRLQERQQFTSSDSPQTPEEYFEAIASSWADCPEAKEQFLELIGRQEQQDDQDEFQQSKGHAAPCPLPEPAFPTRSSDEDKRVTSLFSLWGVHVYRGGEKQGGRTMPTLKRFLTAAMILLAVGITTVAFITREQDADPDGAAPEPTVVALEPTIEPPDDHTATPPQPQGKVLASLSRVHDARFTHPDHGSGVELRQGDGFELLGGFVELAFTNGATVVLEGPCEVRLTGDNEMTVEHGTLSARVPDTAQGFTVQTSLMRVVDLGTAFTIQIDETGESQVTVFDGSVVLYAMDDARHARRLVLVEGWQINVDANGVMDSSMRRFDDRHMRIRRSWEAVTTAVQVYGDIELVTDPPANILADQWESDLIRLLPERRNVTLQADLHAKLGEEVVGSAGHPTVVAAGTRVDSYLLHLDRPGRPGTRLQRNAWIHFDRPVLGLIFDDDTVVATSGLLGIIDVVYPGVEGDWSPGLESADVTRISADGRSLELNWYCSGGIDRIRVIVAAE